MHGRPGPESRARAGRADSSPRSSRRCRRKGRAGGSPPTCAPRRSRRIHVGQRVVRDDRAGDMVQQTRVGVAGVRIFVDAPVLLPEIARHELLHVHHELLRFADLRVACAVEDIELGGLREPAFYERMLNEVLNHLDVGDLEFIVIPFVDQFAHHIVGDMAATLSLPIPGGLQRFSGGDRDSLRIELNDPAVALFHFLDGHGVAHLTTSPFPRLTLMYNTKSMRRRVLPMPPAGYLHFPGPRFLPRLYSIPHYIVISSENFTIYCIFLIVCHYQRLMGFHQGFRRFRPRGGAEIRLFFSFPGLVNVRFHIYSFKIK